MGLQGVTEALAGLAGVFVWVLILNGLESILEHVSVSSLVRRYWKATLFTVIRFTLLSVL